MATWFAQIERSMSALGVDTRQASVVGQQGATSGMNAAQGLSSTIVEMESAILTREAVGRYEQMQNNGITGLCTVAANQGSANSAENAEDTLSSAFNDYEQQWIEQGGDRRNTLVETHRLRRTVLCTDSERDMGLCEGSPAFGVPPAGDTDASPFLLRRSYGSTEVDVGSVYVDTLAPFPTIQTGDDAGTVEELAERAARRRELALVAIARRGMTDVLTRGVQGGVAE